MWEVIGHDWARELLSRGLRTGRVRHAYLFTGPPQIGKRTLALDFARALVCQGDNPPCGECQNCQKVQRGVHPDVQVIAPSDGTFKIDQVRALQREAALRPHEAPRKVYVLVDFQQATVEAANALLKTLEEPPEHVVLLLTATEADLLLPTIVSRCQVLALRPLPGAVVEEALQHRWGVDTEQARLLSRLCGGRLGWAVEAAQESAILERRRAYLDELVALLEQGRVERMAYAERLSRQPPLVVQEVLETWTTWWRDVLLVATGSRSEPSNADRIETLQILAARYGLEEARQAIKELQEARWRLEHNANLRLTLEVLLLSLPENKVHW